MDISSQKTNLPVDGLQSKKVDIPITPSSYNSYNKFINFSLSMLYSTLIFLSHFGISLSANGGKILEILSQDFNEKRLNTRMAIFEHLEVLDSEKKNAIRVHVTEYQKQLAKVDRLVETLNVFKDFYFDQVVSGIASIILLAILFIIFIVPAQLHFVSNTNLFDALVNTGSIVELVLISGVTFLWVILIFYLPRILLTKIWLLPLSNTQKILVGWGWPNGILIICLILLSIISTAPRDTFPIQFIEVAPGLVFATFFCLNSIISSLMKPFTERTVENWKGRFFPIAEIVNSLIIILKHAEDNQNGWVEIEDKKRILSDIENVAVCFERYLPDQLHIGDTSTDSWLKETTKQIATALRDKKKWILTPKKDTYNFFIENIASTLMHVIEGEWDSLEKTKLEQLSPLKTWHLRAIGFFKALLTAILPTIGFIAFQLTPWHLTEPIRQYAIFGLVAWTLLTFIAALDPNFGSKITAIKDVTSLLK